MPDVTDSEAGPRPQISLIMPVYNGLNYIDEAVQSVLSQEFDDWELVISDNGSNDGTHEYLAGLHDARIKVHIQGKNLGIYGNLNFLFENVCADIAYILCHDDYLLPDGLTTIIEKWRSVGGDVGLIRFGYNEASKVNSPFIPEFIPAADSDAFFLLQGNLLGNLSCCSVRPELVKQAGMFPLDIPYSGDFEGWTRVARLTTLCVYRKPATFIRRHEAVSSNTLNKKGELVAQLFSVVDGLYQRAGNRFQRLPLRIYLNLRFVIQHRHIGFKRFLKTGKPTYLKAVSNARYSFTASVPVQWLLYAGTFCGKWRGPHDYLLKGLLRSLGVDPSR